MWYREVSKGQTRGVREWLRLFVSTAAATFVEDEVRGCTAVTWRQPPHCRATS
jgi:hypothetical protein